MGTTWDILGQYGHGHVGILICPGTTGTWVDWGQPGTSWYNRDTWTWDIVQRIEDGIVRCGKSMKFGT